MKKQKNIKELAKKIDKETKELTKKQQELEKLSTTNVSYHFLNKNLVNDVNKALNENNDNRVTIVNALMQFLGSQNTNIRTLCDIMLTLSTAEVSLYTKVHKLSYQQKNCASAIDDLYGNFIETIDNPNSSFEERSKAFNALSDATQSSIVETIKNLLDRLKLLKAFLIIALSLNIFGIVSFAIVMMKILLI